MTTALASLMLLSSVALPQTSGQLVFRADVHRVVVDVFVTVDNRPVPGLEP